MPDPHRPARFSAARRRACTALLALAMVLPGLLVSLFSCQQRGFSTGFVCFSLRQGLLQFFCNQ